MEVDKRDIEIESDTDNHVTEISVENRANEDVDNQKGGDNPRRVTRLGRVTKPHDFAKHFPETAHTKFGATEGRWLKPHYFDEINMVEKLSD